jgi:hypothetical protein
MQLQPEHLERWGRCPLGCAHVLPSPQRKATFQEKDPTQVALHLGLDASHISFGVCCDTHGCEPGDPEIDRNKEPGRARVNIFDVEQVRAVEGKNLGGRDGVGVFGVSSRVGCRGSNWTLMEYGVMLCIWK